MADARVRGWGPGWPHCSTAKIKVLKRADGLRIPLREEILPLVAWLMDETERRGYDIRVGETWGYACRAIRGSSTASNHSWGLAIDINAPANPMLKGKPGWQWLHDHGRTDMPKWLPELWIANGFYWGGNYATRQDAMHVEFLGTPGDAKRLTDKLIAAPAATPKTSWREGDVGADVAYIQGMLNLCWQYRITDSGRRGGGQITKDGRYQGQTKTAVREFERYINLDLFKQGIRVGIPEDGIVDQAVLSLLAATAIKVSHGR